jgi:hypothetical protein
MNLRGCDCLAASALPACAMLLPSGRANTRCSVCRFDPGGLHVQLRPAPGTGLESPETGSQNRRYRALGRYQRPHAPHLNCRNARKLRAIRQRPENGSSHRTAWWWMQPASNRSPTSNSLANREINKGISRKQAIRWDFDAQSASQFNGLQPNSLRNGTGNFQTRIRENFSRNREFSCQMLRF